MTDNNTISIEDRKQLDRELNLGLGISKALGELRFLAGQLDSNRSNMSITQGMAIMDALYALEQARKAWQDIAHAKLIADKKKA